MPRGAAVIKYEGARGVVWRVKYADADGRQVQETLGRAKDGWTERKANAELRARLVDVDREGMRRAASDTFGELADRYRNDYLPGRNRKPSYVETVEQHLDGHLVPFFGSMTLAELERRPERVDAFIAQQTRAGLSPKTIRNHAGTLRAVLKVAVRWKLIRANPAADVELPRLEDPTTEVLTDKEIVALRRAFVERIKRAETKVERMWLRTACTMVFVALGTGLRRGELLGLRWRHVSLLEGRLTVHEAIVRHEVTSPKSKSSRRTLELGPQIVLLLEEHWRRTPYKADDDLVFASPTRGRSIAPSRFVKKFVRPAMDDAGIDRSFRPFHGLRHSCLTYEAAAGNPHVYVQMKAGHSQAAMTERYIHAAQVLFPGAAEKGENRIFGPMGTNRGTSSDVAPAPETGKAPG